MNKTICLLGVLLLAVAAVSFVSCVRERPEGAWHPMAWRTATPLSQGNRVEVPSRGGTYTFSCSNYSTIWMASAREDGVAIDRPGESERIVGRWSDVQVEGRTFTVVVAPNTTRQRRVLKLILTAGDIFDGFSFEQP